tara:strand:- start:1387 stop:1617 length:231 start_codon:yes stop_codon:yes gene_type:complete
MPKKGKVVIIKPITDHNKLQIDILKLMTKEKEKQVTPNMMFEGYKKTNCSKGIKVCPKGHKVCKCKKPKKKVINHQ